MNIFEQNEITRECIKKLQYEKEHIKKFVDSSTKNALKLQSFADLVLKYVIANKLPKEFVEEFIKITATAFILNIFMPSGLDYMCFSLILADVISEVFSFIFALLRKSFKYYSRKSLSFLLLLG